MRPGVALIGCGAIGRKRAAALGPAQLVACSDVVIERAESLASATPGAVACPNWHDAITHRDVTIVIVATTNDVLAPITTAAVEAGKHVLVEKPAARSTAELDQVIAAAASSRAVIRVGFNHRYHPALRKSRELVDAGALGPLMFLRARYGHGGRVGYDREWRANRELSGGGALIDQGVHVIDLARWFLGEFAKVDGFVQTYFWDMAVDDNAFALMRTADDRTAWLHVSCTEWKNLFSVEIYGRAGKIHIEGLGGSYGTERVAFYRMRPEMGPPETTIWEYPGADISWSVEFEEFLEDARLARQPAVGLPDARSALAIVERIYRNDSSSVRIPVGSLLT